MQPGLRINLPGTREEDCFGWTYESVGDVGTEMAGQEYLQMLVRQRPFDIDRLLQVPDGVDGQRWVYEHMRQICIEMGLYVAQIHKECTEEACPAMQANGSPFYCAAHGRPRACSAIGYAVHTLDSAVRLLGSAFPDGSTSDGVRKHLQPMMRRLYRIFAHAYFHHREFFERQEAASYLYARFVRLGRKHALLPAEQLTIPDLPTTVEPPR
ncbi:hypothetical protein H4R19_001281 [Coemansia spiralis]|nr:hypothetical protein H4R19_001281 [Coemansia spiralis]